MGRWQHVCTVGLWADADAGGAGTRLVAELVAQLDRRAVVQAAASAIVAGSRGEVQARVAWAARRWWYWPWLSVAAGNADVGVLDRPTARCTL